MGPRFCIHWSLLLTREYSEYREWIGWQMGIGHGPVTCLEATRMLLSIDSLRRVSILCVTYVWHWQLFPTSDFSRGQRKERRKFVTEMIFDGMWMYIYIWEREREFLDGFLERGYYILKRDSIYGSIQYCLIVFEFLQHWIRWLKLIWSYNNGDGKINWKRNWKSESRLKSRIRIV